MRFLYIFLLSIHVAHAASLSINTDLASLSAKDDSLSNVLKLFESYEIDVFLDPSLSDVLINGKWDNISVTKLIEQISFPHDYIINWKRMHTPLGVLDKPESILIFRKGFIHEIQKISEKYLDIIEDENGDLFIRNEILIRLSNEHTLHKIKSFLASINGVIIEVIKGNTGSPCIYRIKIPEILSIKEALEKAHIWGIDQAEPNRAFSNNHPDVKIGNNLKSLELRSFVSEINSEMDSKRPFVVVLDSGFDSKYKNEFILDGYNAVDPEAEIIDPTGHGTLVSLIASGHIVPLGAQQSEYGINVMPIRVFDQNGMTSSDTLFRAYQYVFENINGRNFGDDIKSLKLNLSFGTYEKIGFLDDLFNMFPSSWTTFVAAGNDGFEDVVNPGKAYRAIPVGALDSSGKKAKYSNYGSNVFAWEIGEIDFNGKIYKGTSFASPHRAYKSVIDDLKNND